MPLILSETSTKDFTPAPAGTHQALCVDVIDNGLVETKWGEKRKVTIRWQINEFMETGKRETSLNPACSNRSSRKIS